MSSSASEPVLVGVGLATQRESDPSAAAEPLALMLDAVRAAGADAGGPDVLRAVERIYVPRGRWRYRDPGRAIGAAIGAQASTVLAHVGVLQERLIADACASIAAGEIAWALVVGGDCGHRMLQARRQGLTLSDSTQDTTPDQVWRAEVALAGPAELAAGLGDMAVGYYALIESAYRAAHGLTIEARHQVLAERGAHFSQTAAANPHAWTESPVTAAEFAASAANPMLADPYTRLHTSDWSVDQADALLFCSTAAARQAGLDPDRWIHPRASAVSNHALTVAQRPAVHASPGADYAARVALEHAELTPAELDHVDLYSSFPIAVDLHAAAVGVPPDTATFTGGMRFAGGPFNNYALHTTAQLALRLRQTAGSCGLVSSVSGLLTKHAFAVWSRDPAPGGYRSTDVTPAVAAAEPSREIVESYAGRGLVVAATVLRSQGGTATTVCVLDTEDGLRALARSADPAIVEFTSGHESVGLTADVEGIELTGLGAAVGACHG